MSDNSPTVSGTRKARACRACENCRKRKVKCSGGEQCTECRRFKVQCVYRQHYRAKKGFSIKILQSPDFSKRQKLDDDSSDMMAGSVPVKMAPVEQSSLHTYDDLKMNVNSRLPSPPLFKEPLETTIDQPTHLSFVQKLFLYLREKSQLTPAEEKTVSLRSFEGLKTIKKSILGSYKQSKPNIEGRHLTEEQMLQCLNDYFAAYQFLMPVVDPEVWIRKAKTAWRNMEYGNALQFNQTELAIIYLLIALGCSGRVTVKFAGIEDEEWAKEYCRKAKKIMPDVFTNVSYGVSVYLFLMSFFACSQDDASGAYLYAGHAVRCLVTMGHDHVDPSKTRSVEDYNKHRLWVCAQVWDSYWSFCVKRPGSFGIDFKFTEPYAPAFDLNTVYKTKVGHILLKVRMLDLLMKRYTTPRDAKRLTEDDIGLMYKGVLTILLEARGIMENIGDAHLLTDDLEEYPGLSEAECREWYWMRLFSYYLRMVLLRPFFITSVFLNTTCRKFEAEVPAQVQEALKIGTSLCVESAMSVPNILSTIDKRVERAQINWFSGSFLEMACCILLLYAVDHASSQNAMTEVAETNLVNACNYLGSIMGKATKSNNDDNLKLMNGQTTFIGKRAISETALEILQVLIKDHTILEAISRNRSEVIETFFESRLLDDPSAREPDDEQMQTFNDSEPITLQQINLCWTRTLHLIGFQG